MNDLTHKLQEINDKLYGKSLGDTKSVLKLAAGLGVLLVLLTFTSRLVGVIVLLLALLAAAWYLGFI